MSKNTYDGVKRSTLDPAEAAEAVTPSDVTDLATLSRALYVGKGGDLSVVMAAGSTVTLKGVIGGSVLALRVARVNATGTTAADIVALS
jgi:hypothetical protein